MHAYRGAAAQRYSQAGGQRSRYQLFHSSCIWVLPPRPPFPPREALPQHAHPHMVCCCDEPPLLVWVQVWVCLCPDPGTVIRWPPLHWGSGPDGQPAGYPSCSTVFLSDTQGMGHTINCDGSMFVSLSKTEVTNGTCSQCPEECVCHAWLRWQQHVLEDSEHSSVQAAQQLRIILSHSVQTVSWANTNRTHF